MTVKLSAKFPFAIKQLRGDRSTLGRLTKRLCCFMVASLLLTILTSCGVSPRVMAQDRMFLDLSLEFLSAYEFPKMTFQDTTVGGLSAITYDRNRDLYYALSDDRSNLAPARFYTLKPTLSTTDGTIAIDNVAIENVTFLKDETGETYPAGSIDAEGIAFSPRNTLFIASEGAIARNILPFIGEFEINTGQKRQNLTLPQHYLPQADSNKSSPKGVQDNQGFEALAVSNPGLIAADPFRLFTATESALIQDENLETGEREPVRLLHYALNSVGRPIVVAEHAYLLDPAPVETISNGLTELLTLDREGYFLSLERTFGLTGAGAKIFQVVNGNATDTTNIESLQENGNVIFLEKKLLLDLSSLGIYLDNLEGMCLGSRLPDGSQSVWLISDDNFNEQQTTQLLLFRLKDSGT